uniref:Major facilitator superfamily (MFS) profile domain-containing protein n=1 Tax=Trichuris muris TaxID=70415 RepID=A0A5S6R6A3_TRIMR
MAKGDSEPDSIGFGETSISWKSRYASVAITDFVLFLQCVQYSIYFSSLWPHLKQIDSQVEEMFFGWTVAIYSIGQLVASPLFGFLSNWTKRCRWVFVLCICSAIFANSLYVSAELFSSNRRYAILVARLFMGVAAGMNGTAIGYVAMSSSLAKRDRAVSVATACMSLGFIAGPALQAAVSFLGYPGVVHGFMHLNLYTAPAYVTILLLAVALGLTIWKFQDGNLAIAEVKAKGGFYIVPQYNKTSLLAVIWCWFSFFVVLVDMDTISTPICMAYYSWSGEEATFYVSLMVGVGSVFSVIIYAIHVAYLHKFDERWLILSGATLLLFAVIISYPYPGWLSVADGLEHGIHCPYDWCQGSPKVPLPIFILCFMLVFVSFPPVNAAVSTLYTKVIGPREQAGLQSVLTCAGSFARLLCPIATMQLFVSYEPAAVWLMTGSFALSTILVTTLCYKVLIPLQVNPRLKAGQSVRYDHGVVTKY